MKILILMVLTCWCLTVSGQTPAVASKVKTLAKVDQIGDPPARYFFVFSTDSRNSRSGKMDMANFFMRRT